MADYDSAEARRERLQRLRQQRRQAPAAADDAGDIGADIDDAFGDDGASPKTKATSRKDADRKQMIRQKITDMISRAGGREGGTPIPGTNFTEEGVNTAVKRLRAMAQNQSSRGGAIAERVLTFLQQPSNDPNEMIAGVNVKRLQQLSRVGGKEAGTEGTAPVGKRRREAQAAVGGAEAGEERPRRRRGGMMRELAEPNAEGAAPGGAGHLPSTAEVAEVADSDKDWLAEQAK